MTPTSTPSLADRPTYGDGEALVADWLRAVVAGAPAPLGRLDEATAYALRSARLEALARAHGAEHENLVGVERRQFARAALSAAATSRIVEMLAAAGVRTVVLKGLPLAERYWGDASLRPSVDLDLLVARGDYAATRDVLIANGFTTHEEWVPAWYLKRWFYHETLFGTGALGISVEIHWDYVRPGLGDTDVPGLLVASEDVTVAGRTLPAPSPPWQLLVVAAHAVHESFGARHLLDVALVARTLDDMAWRTAVDVAEAARLGPTLWYGVRASSEWLTWRPPDVLDRLRPGRVRDEIVRRYVARLPLFGRPSRLDEQLQHLVAPALSSDGARAVTRIPFALLTDRGNLAMRIERGRRRLRGRGQAAPDDAPRG